eukprot:scaffold104073_cov29-Attheya_sp.AAC.1
MPESDRKPSTTTCSKSQAFDLEALQLLVTSNANAKTADETTASMKDLGKKLSTLETTVAATDKKVSKMMKKIDINQAIQDDHQDNTTKGKIRDGRFQHEQEVLHNNDLQTDLDKLKQAPATMRATTSYGGIHSPVPADMTADKYYQDVMPANHNIQGSYIDPATPMPTGMTGSYNFVNSP